MYLMFLHVSPIQSSPGLFALWNIKSDFSHLFCEKRKLAVGVSEEHELVQAETCGRIDVGSREVGARGGGQIGDVHTGSKGGSEPGGMRASVPDSRVTIGR